MALCAQNRTFANIISRVLYLNSRRRPDSTYRCRPVPVTTSCAGSTGSRIRHNGHYSSPMSCTQTSVRLSMWSSRARSCWKCAATVNSNALLCDGCSSVQPLDADTNYFEVFGLDQSFEVDESRLTTAFRALQALFHPDKFAGKSEPEQRLSTECSSFLNGAYQTLSSPHERGEYLLRLRGGRDAGETGYALDGQFLAEIMQINEALAEGAPSKEELHRMDAENGRARAQVQLEVSRAFAEDDLELVGRLLAKLRYFANIDCKIRALELDLGIVH